jgi:DNA adenine methylase
MILDINDSFSSERPVFPMYGCKFSLMPFIVPLMGEHRLYVSVCGGTGAEILGKPPSPVEVFNDPDEDIFNLFRVVAHPSRSEQLFQRVGNTHFRARAIYQEAERLLHDPEKRKRPVDWAWAFLVVAHQGYRSRHPLLRGPDGYAALKKPHRCYEQWATLPEDLKAVRERFARVQIEKLDYREVLVRFDGPETFFYVDPGYHPDTRNGHRYYVHDFISNEDHVEILARVQAARGKVMLSGYSHPLYEKELCNWRRHEFPCKSPHQDRDDRIEVVWLNYDERGRPR